MNNTITIRRIETEDIESVLSLGQWLITRGDIATLDYGGDNDLSFVLEIDDQIAGFLLAKLEYIGIPFQQICVIHSILVNYDFRGQSIGSQLVNHLISYCRSRSIDTIRALVPGNNHDLIRFVTNLEFKPSGIQNYDLCLGKAMCDKQSNTVREQL